MTKPMRVGLALLVLGVLALYVSYLLDSGGWSYDGALWLGAAGSLGVIAGLCVTAFGLLRRT